MKLVIVALCACAAWCQRPVPPPPTTDEGTASCTDACQNAQQLHDKFGSGSGCRIAETTKKGFTCEQVCQNAISEGIQWPTNCIATAVSCEAIHDCQ